MTYEQCYNQLDSVRAMLCYRPTDQKLLAEEEFLIAKLKELR